MEERIDISKEIEESIPKQKELVSSEIAKTEEKISTSVGNIPMTKDELEERKKKIVNFLKKKKDWIFYILLLFIISISVYIRTRPIPKLKDITTGTWTLGPDLDPFLFLRWAKYIVEHGKLFLIDTMRYVPLGYDSSGEMKLLSYMIAGTHNIFSFFSKEVTVTYSAIIFPVIMFALTALAFFLFTRKIFHKKDKKTRNIIALIATSFFVLIPSLLPRTIAGIPEKESVAFFFMFMAFYLFLEAFTSEKLKKGVIFGFLAGISTALMALIWGGVIYIFITIPTTILLTFLFGKIKKKEFFIFSIWLITSFIFMIPFSTRYALKNLIMSTSTGFAIGIFAILGISLVLMEIKKLDEIRKRIKLPKKLFAIILSILILLVILLIAFGPKFLITKISTIKNYLISPMVTRFGLTVAENKQPYFLGDWTANFGPMAFGIPLFFWMFIVGSGMLFNNLIKKLEKKEKRILTSSYFLFLICIIFSRYSPNSILNGTSALSLIIYFGGWLLFLGSFGYIYYKRHKKENIAIFKEFDFSYILYFIILTLGIIGARGGIRLIMVLGAVSPIAVSFLIVNVSKNYLKKKNEMKMLAAIIASIVILAALFTLGNYYQQDKYAAENFAPGGYQMQWQKAMEWIRTNTPMDSVFAHWWDYGYWLQSIGERATILDGGNAIVYWNYLMGRHVLTESDEQKALEFLYTHNATHLLIDSTDIGKYTAFSSIGSDENYDRFSWIPTLVMDDSKTFETKEEVIYVYSGGAPVDEDIIWKEDKEIFLPKKKAVMAGVLLKQDEEKIFQPKAIFVYNGNQYEIPLRFAYLNEELHDFGGGLDAGIFIFPKLDLKDGGVNVNQRGTLMYLSRRTLNSQLVKLYLFNQKSNYFKLAHSEKNLIIEDLERQGLNLGEFVYYQGFQGPIKIWEIEYPSNTKINPDYLELEYPNKSLEFATSGEYN